MGKMPDEPTGGVSLHIPIAQRDALKKVAKSRQMLMSDVMREAFTQYLDKAEVPCPKCIEIGEVLAR